ncbi:MAG: HVO_0758 family zinc finger protein [Halobacteriota archaeon]
MKSVRQGLRDGELARDTFDRLSCTRCEVGLRVVDDPDELGPINVCPECGNRWRDL